MNDPSVTSDARDTLAGRGDSIARLRMLFDLALDMAPGDRPAWIFRNVPDANDHEVLARLLAAADEIGGGFLDTPVAEHASALAADSIVAESLLGQRIGAFRLVRLLGKGGMAAVFLATREGGDFRQDVAIKLLRRGLYSEIEQRLFQRERRVLASLNHPNIARLIDGGLTEAGVPYLVMEYVDGEAITLHASARALDLRARLALFLTVCRAVEGAHRALIVHRDIKPSNILVATDGSVKLLDFGIAKLLEDNVEGATIGIFTPDYAAPEQIAGKVVTTATDVYALGVLLHELLLGARPGKPTRRPSALADANRDAARVQLQARLRGDLDNILLKALDAEPDRRYASAGAFADDIERHLAGLPVAAHPPSRWYRTRKFVARHKGGVLTTAAFLLAIIAALGVALWQAGVAREQARVAHEEAERANAVQSFLVGVFDSNSSYQDDPARARATTAEQLLAIGAEKIDGAMADVPDAKVRMLRLLADLHGGLGLDEKSVALLRKAVDVARAAHGERSLESFDAEIALAEALHSADSDAEAGAVLKHAEATLDASRDADPRRRSLLFDRLGEFYATRDTARALDYERRSIALFETLPQSYDYAFALSHKARAERQAGLDDDAIASYRRAIAVSVAIDGERSPDLPRYYAELAEIETAHHDIGGGEASARRALASAKAIHGENHVDVAQCEMRLGRLLFDTDRTEEGLALIADARAKTLALRGADDGFHTPQMRYQYGVALVRRGRIEDGLAELDAAIANRRAHRPGTIPLAQFLEGAALGQIALGGFGTATQYLDEASAIRAKSGQKAPSAMFDPSIVTRIHLALAAGDARGAVPLVSQLASASAPAGSVDRQILLDRLAGAEVAIATHDAAAAMATARSVRHAIDASALAKYYGPLRAHADFVEGMADLEINDARAARPLLQAALAERVRNLDPAAAEIAEAEIALAEAALAEGDIGEAKRLAEDATRIQASHKALGPQFTQPLQRLLRDLAAAHRA